MTILEAKYEFGTRKKITSKGDSLSLLVRKIYESNDSKYYKVIKTLNTRFDWFNIAVGSSIEFLSKDVVDKVDEV